MIVTNPNTTINILPAQLSISNDPQKVLFVGQMKTGTAIATALTSNIGNTGQEDALFGATSMLAQMIREARILNDVTQFDAIALADAGGGVAATGTIVFSGTATAAGTLNISIGSSVNYKASVPVAVGDTATVVGAALAAITATWANAPFTAANSSGTVTVTSVHKGTFGNNVAYRVDGVVAGITVALTAPVNGATDPTLTGIFSVITGERYQSIVWPEGYSNAALLLELDTRFNFANNILDGVGVKTQMDTYANLVTAGNAVNDKSLVIFGNKKIASATNSGGMITEMSDVISAQIAALRALRLTAGADISQFTISTTGALDSFGGPAIASLPYFNTPMPLLPLVDRGLGFTATEIAGLITAGISIVGNNKTATSVILGEVVTTYKTNVAGAADPTFKYLNNVDTSSSCREYFFNNLRNRFSQCRLTQGDLIPNRSMANVDVISSYLDSLYNDLSGQGFVLTQAGATARAYFKKNRTVALNLVTGTVTITMLVPIVVQLRTIVATMQISFSTEG